jgi:CHASE2 domain-containing sensor protein
MFVKFLKGIFNWLNFFGTVTIFVSMFLLQQLFLSLDLYNFKFIASVIADYNVTDIVFSRSSKLRNEPELDTNIVIVNIGALDRADLAQQISILNKHNPKVIAIDAMFDKPTIHEQDSLLEISFAQTPNLVLGTNLVDSLIIDKKQPKPLVTSLHRFHQHADRHGFLNTTAKNNTEFDTWRETVVKENIVGGIPEYSFAVEVCRLANPELTDKFLQRGNEYEIINYRGNIVNFDAEGNLIEGKFTVLDIEEVMEENFEPEVIRNKVVLLGYLGETLNSTTWKDDKYYTPINEQQVGRTQPDMYRVVGHANIVSMILNKETIDEVPTWFDPLVAFLLCYINVALFSYINYTKGFDIWYGVLTKVIQIVEALLLTFFIVLFFAGYHIKLDFTITVTAVLLAGDILEIYYNLFLNLFEDLKRRWQRYRRGLPPSKVSLDKKR